MTTVLYDSGWFTYNETEEGVTYLAERKDGVSVLCYDFGKRKFLLLHERCGFTMRPEPVLCSLTGSMDKGEDPRETALRELSEEAGVVILSEKLHYLSTVHSYKACTKETHLFFADITGAGFIRPVGDGSEIEEEAFVRWHSLDDLLAAKDSLLLASYALAIKHLIL